MAAPGGTLPFDERRLQEFHRNERHVFYRTEAGGQSLVVKCAHVHPVDPDTIASLRHEFELLHGVALPYVVRVTDLVRLGNGLAIVMHDAGKHNLAQRVGPGLSTDAFLHIAPQLAQALAGVHEAGILHRNVNPSNIAWDDETNTCTLLDFGIAVPLARLTTDDADPVRIEGDLRYISPEQTGRTARSIDARSDLYSLGATFYAMLVGVPPFQVGDPVELVHAHLARRPRAPHAVDARVPPLLSALVMKLLEKEPEQRYLSADAVLADLRRAARQWTATGTVAPFVLAEHDTPRRLSIPEKLYGRDAAVATLRAAFERARAGRRELALVSGAPGIGKSALVRNLEHDVAKEGGYFIGGKFDQLQRAVPYSGLVQAFRTLVLRLLAESDTTLAAWRARIQAAVAPNGRLLADLIPEIEDVIGAQAPVVELGPVESRNRFNQVFTALVGVFARPEHPFVLFLDDLQWADAASLQLLERWIAGSDLGHLLVVGAYRDREVGLDHPLARLLADLRAGGAHLPELRLEALGVDDVAGLLADTLRQEPARCRPLAELVLRKTAGNPFFIRRLLLALHQDGLLAFDAQARAWQWDIDALERAPVGDNVLDLMVQAIGRLPPATRDLIQAGACIGHRFDVGVLTEVAGLARTDALAALWPALESGLLQPLQGAYKAPRQAGPLDQDLAALPVLLRFVHDRVQQAAYSLLDDARRRALHLRIGRALLRRAGADLDAGLFDVVDQLDLGEALVEAPEERLRLAQLNLAAGRKALAAAAYQAAFDYLSTGRRQLAPDAWQAQPLLAFALHRDLAEAAYLAGRHADAERVVEAALAHAPSKIARADLYSLRVLAATVAGDWDGALRWGREGLAVFGHAWPLDGLLDANEAEARAVVANLAGQRIEDLVDQPQVEDEAIRACMRLLALLGPPAYFSGSAVLAFLVTRAVNLSLLHGPSVYSSYAFVFHGALQNARTGEYDVGYAFGKLALALARRFGNRAEESRTVEVFGLVVHCWIAPVRDSLALMRAGHDAGVESGELAYAAFNLCGLLINGLPGGVALDGLQHDAAIAIEFATRCQNRTAIEISLPFRQLARALTGRTRALGSFDDDEFDTARFIDDVRANQTAMGQFWVARLQAAFIARDLDGALHAARQGAECIQAGILGMVTSAEHTFYTALVLAGLHDTTPGPQRPALLDEVRRLHAQLDTWAGYCPENFRHKQALVAAELERIAGTPWQALALFGAAADGARQGGFAQDAALADELAALFFGAHGQARLADACVRAAIDGYRRWGASAKADALEQAHGLRAVAAPAQPAPAAARLPAAALDALGLIKASQAISAEHVPERLFERILRIVIEVAGARSGALLLGGPGALRLRARAAADDTGAGALLDVALDDDPAVPGAIARYVARTREALVLANAGADGPFAADAQVRALGLRAVLCVPLRKQDQVVGLLYLENAAMAGAFTADRVDVVQALAAQAVISLENSLLLQQRARAEAAARFLAGAGAALARSLDYEHTLGLMVDLAVPSFADGCMLDLVRPDGSLQRAHVAFAEPAYAPLADAPHDPPAARALHEGQALLLKELAPAAPDTRLSLIAAPLVARERVVGVLTFVAVHPGRRYDEADLAVARQLAERCALALDNAALYRAARDAVRVREDFLAVASHELKTPLTPLLLQIHLMERRLPKLVADPQGAAWVATSLATLQRQGRRLDRLVSELLDISRIAGGQLQLNPATADLVQLVRDAFAQLEQSGLVAQSGSVLTVSAPDSLPGRWDPLRIDQVLTNLFSNALKYGEGKPVAIDVRVENGRAVVAVADQGMGIEPEHLERIFGRFERAVSARQYSGLGLGLYIASQIVEASGGAIAVASVLGRGSVFTLTLPLDGARGAA